MLLNTDTNVHSAMCVILEMGKFDMIYAYVCAYVYPYSHTYKVCLYGCTGVHVYVCVSIGVDTYVCILRWLTDPTNCC